MLRSDAGWDRHTCSYGGTRTPLTPKFFENRWPLSAMGLYENWLYQLILHGIWFILYEEIVLKMTKNGKTSNKWGNITKTPPYDFFVFRVELSDIISFHIDTSTFKTFGVKGEGPSCQHVWHYCPFLGKIIRNWNFWVSQMSFMITLYSHIPSYGKLYFQIYSVTQHSSSKWYSVQLRDIILL